MRLLCVNQVSRTARIPRAVLLRLAARAQARFGRLARNRSVSVVFVSPAASKKLNAAYRLKPHPASVLSFASAERDELGDIVICPELARAHARAAGVGFWEYVARLFVHGLLHLLGFEHHSEREERRMEEVAGKMLNTK